MKKQIPRGYLDEDMRSCGETWKAVRWKKYETETEAKIGLNLLIETMEREET